MQFFYFKTGMLFSGKTLHPTFHDKSLLKKKYGLQIGIEIVNANF
ncbi:hypothetical protein J2783_000856 [Chryseobacterium sediminis]|nr:hypothetical protein [Chryseobacterium sediminis]